MVIFTLIIIDGRKYLYKLHYRQNRCLYIEKTVTELMLFARIEVELSSNLGLDAYFSDTYHCFPLASRIYAGILLGVGHDHFFRTLYSSSIICYAARAAYSVV
jgi:hypothetical protein